MSRPPTHHPGYNNMKTFGYLESDEYEVSTKCTNCGDYAYIAAKKGIKAQQASSKIPCRKCGCYTLKAEKP